MKCLKTCTNSPYNKIDIGYLFFGEMCFDACSDVSTDNGGRCECPVGTPYIVGPNSHFNGIQENVCAASCPSDDAANKKYYYTGTNKICFENACQLGIDRRISNRVLPSYYVDLYLWPLAGSGVKGECRPTCSGLHVINENGICRCKSDYVMNSAGVCIPVSTCFSDGK